MTDESLELIKKQLETAFFEIGKESGKMISSLIQTEIVNHQNHINNLKETLELLGVTSTTSTP
jgi:hypothetical protein